MDMVSLKSKRVSSIQTSWWKLGQLRAKNWVEKLIIIKRLIRQKKAERQNMDIINKYGRNFVQKHEISSTHGDMYSQE